MQQRFLLIPALLLFLQAEPGLSTEASLLENLQNCARIADKAMRFDCYEALGSKALNEPTAISQPAHESSAVNESFGRSNGAKNKSFTGRVSSCKKSATSRWFFMFDNQQIWQEVQAGRRRFKDCDFEATVSRDTFGYKMMIEGEKRKIRVKRIR